MSTYQFKAKHKLTGNEVEVWAYDDYFARHVYGYQVSGSDAVLTEESFNKEYTSIQT